MARQETQAAPGEDAGAQAVARAQLGTVPGGLGHLFRQRRAASGQLNRLERQRVQMAQQAAAGPAPAE